MLPTILEKEWAHRRRRNVNLFSIPLPPYYCGCLNYGALNDTWCDPFPASGLDQG